MQTNPTLDARTVSRLADALEDDAHAVLDRAADAVAQAAARFAANRCTIDMLLGAVDEYRRVERTAVAMHALRVRFLRSDDFITVSVRPL